MEKNKLSKLAKIYNGNSINAKTKADKYSDKVEGYSYIGTKDVGINGQITYDTGVMIPFEEKGFKIAPANCVLVCSEGGSAGKKTAYNSNDICFGNKLYAITNDKGLFNAKYLYYFTRYQDFFKQFKGLMNGIIGGVSSKKFGEIQIPLPKTIQEQEKIVEKIEELFSELDKGIEELTTAKAKLKVYRQAVLKEAFELAHDAETHTVNSVCNLIIDCPHSTPKWTAKGHLCLRTTNFRRGSLDLSEKNYVSEETFKERILRGKPQSKDILYSREGAILGIACMVPEETELCLGQRMMLMRVSDKCLPHYLMHYLNSPAITSIVVTSTGGSASPHINIRDIKKFDIPVPLKKIQEKIVLEIESRLSICDNIEATIEESLVKAERLRQSILKEAFEGRLV